LLIHRPRYDDWTLPKGKADPGESDEDCARREVTEETGMLCTLGPELSTVRYADHRGRPKVVRYWAMQPQGAVPDEFQANDEVDRLRWVPASEVRPALSYDHDQQVIDAFDMTVGGSGKLPGS
jgi:8-oxo-dGTP diphosphatase